MKFAKTGRKKKEQWSERQKSDKNKIIYKGKRPRAVK
jgi:hypothetical protein